MEVRVQAYDTEVTVIIHEKPNECPYCFKIIEPWVYKGNLFMRKGKTMLDLVFRCTARDCRRLFIGLYYEHSIDSPYNRYTFNSIVAPSVKPAQTLPASIIELSPLFPKIYEQAHAAEQIYLDQIAGLGYRKSLEFLIKDYLIKAKPEDETKIKKQTLNECVNNLPLDASIIDIIKRAVWIGNDETHYVRTWHDKDINDLKTLIDIIINLIDREFLMNKYVSEMPVPKKTSKI